jgi:hypothetical protein
MVLYEHKFRQQYIEERIKRLTGIVLCSKPPECECKLEPETSSGNIRLGVRASYSDFKYICHPDLRTFIYSKGPVYFTKVVKKPTYKGVPLLEVDRNGNPVYN